QETLIEARRDFWQFAGGTQAEFVAWLRRILFNNLANIRRRYKQTGQRGIDRELPLDGDESWNLADGLCDPSATPQAKAAANEENELVDLALAQLPLKYQEVLRL